MYEELDTLLQKNISKCDELIDLALLPSFKETWGEWLFPSRSNRAKFEISYLEIFIFLSESSRDENFRSQCVILFSLLPQVEFVFFVSNLLDQDCSHLKCS